MATIREELERDFDRVREVTRQAFAQSEFGHHGEADLIARLRSSSPYYLSLVAEVDAGVVGHILFTPAAIKAATELTGMGLGPMSVIPSFQGRQIGTQLVEAGLAQLRQAGCPFVVVLGHPEFYRRFGFLPASSFGVGCEFAGIPEKFLQLIRLGEHAIPAGTARYQPEFYQTG